MMQTALHSTPRPRDVLVAQIRLVGCALRGSAIVVGALAAPAALLIIFEFMRNSPVIDFHPEREELLFGMLGLLFSIGIWVGEERIGSGFLWTLPVDRRWHALAKVFAGWVWLMGAVTLYVLWLLVLTLLSGGNMLAEESLRRISSFSFPAGGTLEADVVQTVRWMPEPILWLVPFTAATGTYLLASALALGLRHPLRWVAGTVLALFLIVGVSADANAEWLATAPGRVLLGMFDGPYGLDALLTARTGSLKTEATLSTGETVVVWRALPDLGSGRRPRCCGQVPAWWPSGARSPDTASAGGPDRTHSSPRRLVLEGRYGTSDSEPLEKLPEWRAGSDEHHADDSARDVRTARPERGRQVHVDAHDRHLAGA